jgi:nucleoside-diphosphate-sugar epimerase
MRLLLTGATGFLGRHIIAAATDWQVIRVTRAVEATSSGELALGPAPWTQADFARALAEVRPDVVLHCAGAAYSPNSRSCFDTNAVLAAELLSAAEASSHPLRVMLVGSAAEYGVVPPDAQPVVETFHCAPRTDYGVAKYAQTLLGFAATMRGLPVLVARLFNPVGIGMPRQLALPSFARRIATSESGCILRVGDLSAARDFLDANEAARLLLGLAAMSDWPWPVVNVCSGRAYQLGDLLDRLIAVSGIEVRAKTDPALTRPGDMPILTGSTERLGSVGLAPTAPDFSVLLPRLLAEARELWSATLRSGPGRVVPT